MRFVICGLTPMIQDFLRFLVRDNAVTLIDQDASILEKMEQTYDIQTIEGHPCDLESLKKASLDEDCLVIACTPSDEENLVICRLVKALGVKQTGICLHNPMYMTKAYREHIQDDFHAGFIFSEEEALQDILLNSLAFPSSFLALPFLGQKLSLVGFYLDHDSAFLGKPLKHIQGELRSGKVFGLMHKDQLFVHDLKRIAQPNDGILCLIPTRERARLTKVFGYKATLNAKKLVFMGTKGLRPDLFQELEKRGHGFFVVENHKDKLESLACALPSLLLLCEDPSLSASWRQASHADYAIGLAEHDEKNLAAGFLAKSSGTDRCLLRLENFRGSLQALGVERVFRPGLSLFAMLLRAIKPRFVSHWYGLDPHGCLLEVVINEGSKSLGWDVETFEAKTGWTFLVLARDEEFLWDQEVDFQVKDHVVFWSVSCQCEEIIFQIYDVFGFR